MKITTRISAADWYAQDWLPMPYPPSEHRRQLALRARGHDGRG
ncbi:hypothetical protein ACRAWF_05630 [Streptomyces sp. L7]